MRLDAGPTIGTDAARSVHGYCRGAGVAVVGSAPSADLLESLEPFDLEPSAQPFTGRDGLSALGAWAQSRAESRAGDALVVVAGDLVISPVALLDVLDRPGVRTAVATLEPEVLEGDLPGFTLLRVQRDQRLVHSAGSAQHVVSAPTSVAAGVLVVAPQDLGEAARLWAQAVTSGVANDPGTDLFDLALLALVRGGVEVAAVPLGPFDVRRGSATALGASGSAWQQRLRGASRGGDGFFSTFAVRPLSRRLTGFGLGHGWTPNVVTVTSLAMGLLAAALAAVDTRATWALAAVLLLLALVVDCVDGEIARFTRRFSALGAWLDAVGDRVKEYALVAAVAWVSVRRGEPLWLLAIAALALVTVRHLEDYAYADRGLASRAGTRPDRLAIDEARDLGPHGARVTLPGPQTRRQRAVHWAKKVVHMPIAERYLLLAVGLLTFSTHVVLWAITVAVALALVWTVGGRTVKALLGTDGFRPHVRLTASEWGHLDHQLDLGPFARTCGRVLALPLVAAITGVALVVVASALAWRAGGVGWLHVTLVVVGAVLVGAGCRPPLQHRLGWLAPALLWGAEAVLVLAIVSGMPGAAQWCGYAYLAAVAWHRYDVVYRLRDTGRPAAAWVTTATLGVDGRLVALAVLAAAGAPMGPVLGWSALLLIGVYGAESAVGWRTWLRARAAEGQLRTGGAEVVA